MGLVHNAKLGHTCSCSVAQRQAAARSVQSAPALSHQQQLQVRLQLVAFSGLSHNFKPGREPASHSDTLSGSSQTAGMVLSAGHGPAVACLIYGCEDWQCVVHKGLECLVTSAHPPPPLVFPLHLRSTLRTSALAQSCHHCSPPPVPQAPCLAPTRAAAPPAAAA